MHAIALSDLRTLVTILESEAREAGVQSHPLRLEEGSKLYGRAYRLFEGREGSSADHQPAATYRTDFLGMTKREAYEVLHAYINAYRAANQARKDAAKVSA